jgi:hypothetical protein
MRPAEDRVGGPRQGWRCPLGGAQEGETIRNQGHHNTPPYANTVNDERLQELFYHVLESLW